MILPFVGRETEFTTYNLGSGVGHSVNDVLAVVREVIGHEFDIEEAPAPPTFVEKVILNVDRYTSEFGPHSLTPLEVGIRSTYLEMRDELG